jgi:hypothetical protein
VTTDDNQKQTLIATAEDILSALSEVYAAGAKIGSQFAPAAPSNMMEGDARPERLSLAA